MTSVVPARQGGCETKTSGGNRFEKKHGYVITPSDIYMERSYSLKERMILFYVTFV